MHTQHSSFISSGSMNPPDSIICPVQALKYTAPEEGILESPAAQTETSRQWMVMICTASELRRWMKFIWIRLTPVSNCRKEIISYSTDQLNHINEKKCWHFHWTILYFEMDSFIDLGNSDWLKTGLTSTGEVAGHFNIVRRAAQVRIYRISAFNKTQNKNKKNKSIIGGDKMVVTNFLEISHHRSTCARIQTDLCTFWQDSPVFPEDSWCCGSECRGSEES